MNAVVQPKETSLGELRAIQGGPREANLPAVRAGFFDLQGFELMQRVAKGFASSDLVPQAYKGNVANCMIALNLSQRLGADTLMVMQNLVIVHGRPTWSSQFLIATANMCGRFTALRFEFFGEKGKDNWGCRAWATEKSTGEKLAGADITIDIAKKEGWYGKNGSKWQSIPQQMLMYRAGSWWVRAYAPELSMGLMTADEAGDVYEAEPTGEGTYSVTVESLQAATSAASGAVETDDGFKHDSLAKEKAEIDALTTKADLVAWLNKTDKKVKSALKDYLTAAQDRIDQAESAGGQVVTYAQVAEQLNKAADVDLLDATADLIQHVQADQQDELRAVYNARRAELAGE